MTEVVFQLQGGGVVHVAMATSDQGALVGASGAVIEAKQTFEEAVSGLKPVAEALLNQIRSLAQSPDEVSLEFGVTLKIEAGVLIAKTAGEGNFKVEVKWKRDK
jgi:hypothetical protein